MSWFFAVVLLPGFLIGLFLSYAIYQNEQRSLEQGTEQTARALLQAVDSELIKIRTIALALSKSESLQTHDFAAFHRQASEVIDAVGSGNNCVLSDLDGQQLLNTARPMTAPLPRHGNPEQLRQVIETRRPVISNLYIGAVLKRPLISIDVPVMHEGKPAYVLSIGILPEQFNRLLAGQQLPEGWIAAVLDTQDVVVARNINPQEMVARKATDDVRQKIARHLHGTMNSRSLEGHATLLAYEKSNQTGWTVIAAVTHRILYQDLYRLLGLVVLSLVVFLGSGAALAWFFSDRVRRALKALGTATDAVAMGAPNVRAPTGSGVREIDQLAEQFNTMQEAQKCLEAEIRQMAFHDPLTSLTNRRVLEDHLRQALANNKRSRNHGALFFLDLDNFKTLNDAEGHAAGDLLLIEVANRLRQSVREVDTVARIGGDEFVILVNDLDGHAANAIATARLIAEKIRSTLAQPYFLTLQVEDQPPRAIEHRCTASIGVAVFSVEEIDPDKLLNLADTAMYQAKTGGRNRVHLADSIPEPGNH